MQSTSRLKYLMKLQNKQNQANNILDSPFSILVRCTDHLREVNHNWFTVFATDQNIELVEITMYQASPGEAHYEVHKCRVQLPRRGDL